MKTAIALAGKGAGKVSPNPMVGCVIVKDGAIAGKGYHKYFGGPHAEINALKHAGKNALHADMYINLEPCSHHGKTPPCVHAVIESGIRRVFIGMVDPNPLVSGTGVKKLRNSGISVEIGILEKESKKLNESFIKFISKKIPFVILKTAATLDGKTATSTGDSKWITSEESRKQVHKIRAEVDAVMVGIGTVMADDPLLTVRLFKRGKRDPFRIVVDSNLRIPLDRQVLQPEHADRTIIATSPEQLSSAKARAVRDLGAELIGVPLNKGHVDLKKLIKLLGERNIASLMIEGGATLNAAALNSGIVDKIMFFYAPGIAGGDDSLGMVAGQGPKKIADATKVTNLTIRRIKNDFMVEGYLK